MTSLEWEARLDEAVLEVMHLCLLVNRQTKFIVFSNFWGHINNFEVEVTRMEGEERITVFRVEAKVRPNSFWRDEDFHDSMNKLNGVASLLCQCLEGQTVFHEVSA
jgi:hypothetical protein